MAMSNREITAIEREAKSREDLAKAIKSDKGKEYLKERAALEKAVGGKKKLDKADEILANAEKAYKKRIAEAEKEAVKLREEAASRIQKERDVIAEQARVLANAEKQLEADRTAHVLSVQELNNAVLAVKEREKRVEAREVDVSTRESEVATREREVELRERKAEDIERWAAARPA